MRIVDLCAGTGAFSLAFKDHEVVFSNDFENSSKVIYDANMKNHKLCLKDIHEVECVPEHDILTAGFPCQPFSLAGEKRGFSDNRSNVFWKLLEIIDDANTPIVILENVKNLESHDNGRTFKIIKSELEKRDYNIFFKILNTCDITDIPHNRERIYIVCFKKDLEVDSFDFDFKKVNNKPIELLLDKEVDDKYYYDKRYNCYDLVKKEVKEFGKVYQYRRYYIRENKSGVCPTLTANMGTGGHNVPLILDKKGPRKLTPRECFRLQGFPETYILPEELSDASLYKLAGNAVTLPVVKLIADKISSMFE